MLNSLFTTSLKYKKYKKNFHILVTIHRLKYCKSDKGKYMRILYKYLLWLLSTLMIIIFYLLGTSVGHETLGLSLAKYLSNKTKNEIRVTHLNIDAYPILNIKLKINNGAEVVLQGEANREMIDMDYHLLGEKFKYSTFNLQDPVDINGHIYGTSEHQKFTGIGKILEGKGEFEFIKTPKGFQDINLTLKEVSSVKLFEFLKQKPLLQGKINLDAEMELFSASKRKGQISVHMNKGEMPTVAPLVLFALDANFTLENIETFYTGKIQSDIGSLLVSKGTLDESKKETKCDYILDIKELSHFKKILHHNYQGAFHTVGTFAYNNQKIELRGISHKLGGALLYHYKDKNLDLELKKVSLANLLKQLSYPALFNSEVYGTIEYNLKDKIIIINTKLKKTRFRRTKMTDTVYEATGIDMLENVYDDSSFVGGYQNRVLSSILKIDNGHEHIYLTDTQMNSKTNHIDSKFEIRLKEEELSGTIYGTLKDPKISIDVGKLLRYQLDKRWEGLFGENEQKKVKQKFNNVKEKLENIDIDDVKRKAKSAIDNLF